MVWYIPSLSPIVDQVTKTGADGEDHKVLLSAISNMRIPLEYQAGLFTAGDTVPVELSLRRLAAMRSYMRDINLGQPTNEAIASAVGMTGKDLEAMYRLLAIAKYDDPMSSRPPRRRPRVVFPRWIRLVASILPVAT